MADIFSADKRSWIMSRVKGRNTKPENLVRSFIHHMGYRFRIHRHDLPGNPDIVLPRHKKVIFVHGCFWHGHERCPRSKRPTTNESFWSKKLDKNIKRDKLVYQKIQSLGWKILVIWECEIRKPELLMQILEGFFNNGREKETKTSRL